MAALSLLKALTFGHEVGFQRIMVEFPNTRLKALLNSSEECLSQLQELLVQTQKFYSDYIRLCFSTIHGSKVIEIAEALTPIYCVCILNNIGFIRNRHRSIEKSNHIGNINIYVVQLKAYIHRRRPGESFTMKIRRLQRWHQSTPTPISSFSSPLLPHIFFLFSKQAPPLA